MSVSEKSAFDSVNAAWLNSDEYKQMTTEMLRKQTVAKLNAAANGASLMFFGKVLVDLPRLFAAQIETLKAAIAYGSSHGIKPPADATALLK